MQATAARWLARGLLALVAGGLAAYAGARVLRSRAPRHTVRLVDTSAAIDAHLARRAEEDAPAPVADATSDRLVRVPLDEATARIFFPYLDGRSYAFHPVLHYRRIPAVDAWFAFAEHAAGGWTVRTNSLGMREDAEPRAEPPELRVLVTGDSHMEGVVANHESLPNVLERVLANERGEDAVEVLNAGCGGYGPYEYLGVLEGYLELRPRAFVAMWFGGNDFTDVLPLWRHCERLPPVPARAFTTERAAAILRDPIGIIPQDLSQALYFLGNPEDEAPAATVSVAIAAEMSRICAEHGMAFLAVYLPAPSRAQPEVFASMARDASARLDLPLEALAVSDRLADAWIEGLRARGIAVLDLRPRFARESEPLYWRTDLHLNVRGHRVAAREVHAALAERLR